MADNRFNRAPDEYSNSAFSLSELPTDIFQALHDALFGGEQAPQAAQAPRQSYAAPAEFFGDGSEGSGDDITSFLQREAGSVSDFANGPVGDTVDGSLDALASLFGDAMSSGNSPEGNYPEARPSDSPVSEFLRMIGQGASDFANGPVGDAVDGSLDTIADLLRGAATSVPEHSGEPPPSSNPLMMLLQGLSNAGQGIFGEGVPQRSQRPANDIRHSDRYLRGEAGIESPQTSAEAAPAAPAESEISRLLSELQRVSKPGKTQSFVARGDDIERSDYNGPGKSDGSGAYSKAHPSSGENWEKNIGVPTREMLKDEKREFDDRAFMRQMQLAQAGKGDPISILVQALSMARNPENLRVVARLFGPTLAKLEQSQIETAITGPENQKRRR